MSSKPILATLALAAAAACPTSASALTLNDLDLTRFSFDVVAYNRGSQVDGLGGDATASGTSNGVAWSITPTDLWANRTTSNGSFHFAALPNATDNLHPGFSFTLTFAQPVRTLLVALSNDNLTDSINFGLLPSDMQGVHFNGTQAILNSAAGGLVLFENIDSMFISHLNNNGSDDGFDLAFSVISTVPTPASWLMLSLGLMALVPALRRPAQRVPASRAAARCNPQ